MFFIHIKLNPTKLSQQKGKKKKKEKGKLARIVSLKLAGTISS